MNREGLIETDGRHVTLINREGLSKIVLSA